MMKMNFLTIDKVKKIIELVIYQDIVQKEAFKYTSRLLNRRFSEIDSLILERIQR